MRNLYEKKDMRKKRRNGNYCPKCRFRMQSYKIFCSYCNGFILSFKSIGFITISFLTLFSLYLFAYFLN